MGEAARAVRPDPSCPPASAVGCRLLGSWIGDRGRTDLKSAPSVGELVRAGRHVTDHLTCPRNFGPSES